MHPCLWNTNTKKFCLSPSWHTPGSHMGGGSGSDGNHVRGGIDKTPDNEKKNKFVSANEKPGNGVHNYVISNHPTNPSYFISFLLPAAMASSISPKIRKRDLFLSERQREGQNLLIPSHFPSLVFLYFFWIL